jgi:hypothetical protein
MMLAAWLGAAGRCKLHMDVAMGTRTCDWQDCVLQLVKAHGNSSQQRSWGQRTRQHSMHKQTCVIKHPMLA